MSDLALAANWRQVSWRRYERSDGAAVMWDDRSPYPNPVNPNARMWTAWEPDPSQEYIGMERGRYRLSQSGSACKPNFPRRWKTAKAAMKVVDQLFEQKAEDKQWLNT